MKAWRVHDFGEPQDRFVLDEVPEPTAADLAGMSMSLGGWVPGGPGLEPFDDWVIMRMDMAALALPDVTMCRGTYPVPVLRPYVSGQEGVGTVEDASPPGAICWANGWWPARSSRGAAWLRSRSGSP